MSDHANELLKIKGLTKHFGGLKAIDHLDLSIFKDDILGLVGPNGAGKTTLFNVISGFLPPTSGRIYFGGQNIVGSSPEKIASLGIIRTFQSSSVFNRFTVLENVAMGFHLRRKSGFRQALLNRPLYREDEKQTYKEALEIIDFLGLNPVKDIAAENLPHGHLRALGIAVSLMARPKMLLLDEPLTGISLEETDIMIERIRSIKEKGTTIVLVEHNMRAVTKVCDRMVVLDFGKKITDGTPWDVVRNPEVIDAYLGTGPGSRPHVA